jgi:hypothetical protein
MNEDLTMKPVRFGIAGVVLQGIFLAAFILISRTSIAAMGKPVVIGLALICMVVLLWQGVKEAQTRATLFRLPLLLALGYIIAFHVVGVLGFRGLLRDWDFSADYLMSVLRVTIIVFVLYAIGTALLYLLRTKMVRTNVVRHD